MKSCCQDKVAAQFVREAGDDESRGWLDRADLSLVWLVRAAGWN